MDALDSSLYSQVLSSLASNLASTSRSPARHDKSSSARQSDDSHEDDSELLTNPVDDLVSSESLGHEQLTSDQVQGIVAYAEYTTRSTKHGGEVGADIDRVLTLVDTLARWTFDPESLQARSRVPLPLSEQATFAIVNAALSLAAHREQRRKQLIDSVWQLARDLARDVDTATATTANGNSRAGGSERDDRLFLHTVPALIGLTRSITSTNSSSSTFRFRSDDPAPSFPPSLNPSRGIEERIRFYLGAREDDDSDDSLDRQAQRADTAGDESTAARKARTRAIESTVRHYCLASDQEEEEQDRSPLLSGSMGISSSIESVLSFWIDIVGASSPADQPRQRRQQRRPKRPSGHVGDGWATLVDRFAPSPSRSSIVENENALRTFERSLELWQQTVDRIESSSNSKTPTNDDEDPREEEEEEEEEEEALRGAIPKLATVTSLVSLSHSSATSADHVLEPLVSILESILSPNALPSNTLAATVLQSTALESVQLISRAVVVFADNQHRGQPGKMILLRERLLEVVREFTTSRELGLWTTMLRNRSSNDPYQSSQPPLARIVSEDVEEEDGPGTLVREAAETWIALIEWNDDRETLSSDSDSRKEQETRKKVSTIQTLLNHLSNVLATFQSISNPTSPFETRQSSPAASIRRGQPIRGSASLLVDPSPPSVVDSAKIGQALNAIRVIGIFARSSHASVALVAGRRSDQADEGEEEPLELAQSAFQRLLTNNNSHNDGKLGGGGTTVSDQIVVAGLRELGLIANTIVSRYLVSHDGNATINGEESREPDVDTAATARARNRVKEEFREIARTIGAVGRGAVLVSSSDSSSIEAGTDEPVLRAAVRAFDKLGQVAAKVEVSERARSRPSGRLGLGEDFLIEVLTLFVHRGTTDVEGGHTLGHERRTAALTSLLPVIASYLDRSNSTAMTSTTSTTLSALFRSFWYISLLSSLFASTTSRPGRSENLGTIARRCPPLVFGPNRTGGGDVWVEIEAQINGALKNSITGTGRGGNMSIEAVRGELATELPSQAGLARSCSSAQAVFLATALRLETLRAESGVVAPVFEYFKIPSLSAKETGMADCLKSIGEKVLLTFVAKLSRLVPRHAVPISQTHESLRALLFQAADPNPQVRSIAINFLNELFSSFPSLVVSHAGVVTTMLELLTVLRRSCLSEFLDEYTPTYTFSTAHVSLTLPDDYPLRQRILRELHQNVRTWLKAGLTRSPEAMKGLLMHYIGDASSSSTEDHRMASIVAEEEMGKSVALDLVRTPPANGKSATLPAWGNWTVDSSSSFAKTLAAKSYFGGEAARSGKSARKQVLARLEDLASQLDHHKLHYKMRELRDVFFAAGGLVVQSSPTRDDARSAEDAKLLSLVVSLPVRIYTEQSINIAQDVWTWIVDSRNDLECRLVAEVVEAWTMTIERGQGLFSKAHDLESPLNQETQFTPTDKSALTKEYLVASRLFAPMMGMLDFLSSRFQAFRYRNANLVLACIRLATQSLDKVDTWTHHSLSRELRFRFLVFGFCVCQGSEMEATAESSLRDKLYAAAFNWFSVPPTWSFGTNRIQLKADLQAVEELTTIIETDFVTPTETVTSLPLIATDRSSKNRAQELHGSRKELLVVLLRDEADRLKLWLNPTQDSKRGPTSSASPPSPDRLVKLARFAWTRWPKVVVHLPARFKFPLLSNEVTELVRADPLNVQDSPHALAFFIDEEIPIESRSKLRHLLYWAPVTVPEALRFLFPKYGGDPILLQYALRVLEHHPVGITFFYIPQVVQALRTDSLGYAERFIFETSKISQLFCHQIIWNMKANAYRGDDAEEEDPMKPTLDRVVDMIVDSLSGEAQDFYNREFSFFDEVTSISAKLKPFIKSSKAEKKQKIDEEMAKIKVDVGVYLPSNPDGVVVDINRASGRPLQSHAKAPFMATFKVRRQRDRQDASDLVAQDELIEIEETDDEGAAANKHKEDYDTWQSAIFKVGDDCRQDVLALQIIAMHKNIFNSLGLDLLVTPYRVTATGPGCGVIDVVPNATSRDEMGRAKINDLLSFFTLKYGPVESIEFQKARTNFVQSMAAYSVLCYIIQIKDRHNGNIMIDGRGCITHIDFGFLFDIGPGGIKFEPNSFKLSHEMIVLMGGPESPGFRTFVDLTIKAFLACRPYAYEIVHTTSQMLAAEFPSFKGEPTMDRLLERFRLDLSEREAAKYMMGVIDNAYENRMSILYDRFQLATNGIPYTK
ncbi:hypothetical protein JCM3766R1_005907 [Sporobolomyces carnicolor]